MKKFLHEEAYVEVGFIRKPYGYKGDVKISADDIYEKDIKSNPFLFIHQKGLKVPFKVVEISDKAELIVKLDDINSSEETMPLIGQKVFLLEKDLEFAKDAYNSDQEKYVYVGYTINDKVSGRKLMIVGIEEFPQQLMAVVEDDETERFIPLNDEFIIEINDRDKEIIMELPDGLLSL